MYYSRKVFALLNYHPSYYYFTLQLGTLVVFSCFTLKKKVGGLLGGGGAKGMLAPLSNYWGGGGLAPRPRLPTPMFFRHCHEGKHFRDFLFAAKDESLPKWVLLSEERIGCEFYSHKKELTASSTLRRKNWLRVLFS